MIMNGGNLLYSIVRNRIRMYRGLKMICMVNLIHGIVRCLLTRVSRIS